MPYLGRREYALLLHLSENGRQPLAVDNNKATVGGDAEFGVTVVDYLVKHGLVMRTEPADGVADLDLSLAGRSDLDKALAQKWIVDHSGLHEESRTYRFEVPDQVTGRRFVVSVSQGAGPTVANRVAYGVIATPSVRESCRKIETLGPEGGFPLEVAIEGAGEVNVWRKL